MTIKNDKGRLSQDDIDRMVRDAERFADDDSVQRKRVEGFNELSSFVYGIKSQLEDQKGYGGKISGEDRKEILTAIKDAEVWIDENEKTAELDEFEYKLAGECDLLFGGPCIYLTCWCWTQNFKI